MGVERNELMIEASVEWQGTLLDVKHFPASTGLPQDLEGYAGMSEALGRLVPGGVEHASVGPLSLSIRHVAGGDSVPRKPVEWAPLSYVGATMALAGIFLALMALVPPRGQAMSVPEQTLAGRLVSFDMQAETETFETPPVGDADDEHGAEWGREGIAGSTAADPRSRRRQERASDVENLRAAAARSGILSVGAMFDGVGASPSPFQQALGRDMDGALGNLTGPVIGESFGFGGLAMNGTGRHAGARGLDAIRRPDGMMGLSGGGGACGCGRGADRARFGRDGTAPSGTIRVRAGEPDRVSAVPRIRSTGPEVRGALDAALIRRVVRRHQNETRYCYEQALQTRPDLAGRVEARFIIDPSGSVVTASLQSSTVSSSRVEACVLQVVRRMSFPATPGGNVSIVTYPWVFSTL
ncbi:MAG: TonB family protein [Polyangiales bacterium]|jgi:TonB family protein